MTTRIYYDDAYCREFDAVVTRIEPRGEMRAVWLDRSAFYPTSGGQPFDTGTLAGARVIEVLDEDDDVVHLVEAGAGSPPASELAAGTPVHGVIDWPRRFDHVFASQRLGAYSCRYVDEWRTAGLSDHAAMEVDFAISPQEAA